MAFTTKYTATFRDAELNLYEVKLLEDGGAAATALIQAVDKNAVAVRRRGGKDVQLDNNVFGSELEFRFWVNVSDIADFEAIVEAPWKKWKVEFRRNTLLRWSGYVQSDNYNRPWLPQHGLQLFSLTATDGLANLKNIEFVNFTTGYQYHDRVSLIETIKRSLEHIGLDLDFKVQLGTWVTNDALMVSTECSLAEVTCDNSRFTEIKDGRVVNENGYKLIEKLLTSFNCYLLQQDGEYWVVNPQEKNSFLFPIPWSTLVVGTRTANDLRITIDNTWDFTVEGEVQRTKPLGTVEISIRDRNVGDNLFNNGDFAVGNTNEWTNGNWGVFVTTPAGPNNELNTVYRDTIDTPPSPQGTPFLFHSLAKALLVRGDNDKVSVSFKVRVNQMDFTSALPVGVTERIEVTARLRKGSITGPIITGGYPFTLGVESGYTTKTYTFTLQGDDDYFLEMSVGQLAGAWAYYETLGIRWDDFVFEGLASEEVDITLDSFFKLVNADNAFPGVYEFDTVFGDSLQDNDIGSFKVGVTRTALWSRYSKSEDFSIQRLGGQNILENFSKFKNYIRGGIHDPTDAIKAYSLLRIDSVDYQIVAHEFKYRPGETTSKDVELMEVLNTAINTNLITQQLSSIDGEDTNTTVVTTIVVTGSGSGVTVHGQLSGLDEDDHPQYAIGNPLTNGFVLASTTLGVRSWVNKEDYLGLPSTNGYLLSSTTAGVRSWVAPGSGGASVLNDLTDVTLTTPVLDDFLKYNGSLWVNVPATVSNLKDVTITSIATGELLKWNGTAWINNTLAEANIVPATGGTFSGLLTASGGLTATVGSLYNNQVLTINSASGVVSRIQWDIDICTDAGNVTSNTVTFGIIQGSNLAGGDSLVYSRSADGRLLKVSLSAGLAFSAGVLSIDIPLNTINDVTISSVVSGEILKYNGTIWVNNTLAEAGIEPSLGNPATNGFVLSSTTLGVRSWIASPAKHTIENEGTGLTARASLDFIGGAVNVVDSAVNDASEVNVNPSSVMYHQRDPFVTADIFLHAGNISGSGTTLRTVAPFACTVEEFTFMFWMNTVTTSGNMTFTIVTNSGSQAGNISVTALGFFSGTRTITKLTIAKGDYIYVQASYTAGLAGTSSRGVIGVILKES